MLKQLVKICANRLGYEIKRKNIAETLFDKDNEFNELYNNAQAKTQMAKTDNQLRRRRHYVLNHLLRNTDLNAGDVCELGCWRGLSAYQIATYIKEQKVDIVFHIFDSFDGLSQLEPVDIYEKEERKTEDLRKQFSCSLEEVRENLKAFGFIRFYKGWIPERFSEVESKTFSFVHIDVDLYQPTVDSFEFFYPRLVPGGILVFDDYGCLQFPGAKQAIDECVFRHQKDFFLPLPSGQAFLKKQF